MYQPRSPTNDHRSFDPYVTGHNEIKSNTWSHFSNLPTARNHPPRAMWEKTARSEIFGGTISVFFRVSPRAEDTNIPWPFSPEEGFQLPGISDSYFSELADCITPFQYAVISSDSVSINVCK